MNDNKIIMSIADIRAMCLALSYEEVFTYLMKNTIIATDNLAADWMIRFGAEYTDPRERIDVYEKTIETWQSENPAATLIALKQRWPNAASNITQGLNGDKKAINNVIKDCFVNNVETKARLQDKFDNSPEATVINSVIKDRLQKLDKEDDSNTIYSKLEFAILQNLATNFDLLEKGDLISASQELTFQEFKIYLNNITYNKISIAAKFIIDKFKSFSYDDDKYLVYISLTGNVKNTDEPGIDYVAKEANFDSLGNLDCYDYLTISEIADVANRLHYKDFCNYIDKVTYKQITSPALTFLTRFNAFSEEDKHKKWLELKGIDNTELKQIANKPKTNYIIPMKIKFSGILRQAEVLPDFDAFRNNIIDLHTHSCRCTDKVEVFMFEFVSADLEKQKKMYLDCRLKATKKSSPKELFDLICLVQKLPNDQELGAAIRAQLQFYPTR